MSIWRKDGDGSVVTGGHGSGDLLSWGHRTWRLLYSFRFLRVSGVCLQFVLFCFRQKCRVISEWPELSTWDTFSVFGSTTFLCHFWMFVGPLFHNISAIHVSPDRWRREITEETSKQTHVRPVRSSKIIHIADSQPHSHTWASPKRDTTTKTMDAVSDGSYVVVQKLDYMRTLLIRSGH